jgi:hypothetical protein
MVSPGHCSTNLADVNNHVPRADSRADRSTSEIKLGAVLRIDRLLRVFIPSWLRVRFVEDEVTLEQMFLRPSSIIPCQS